MGTKLIMATKSPVVIDSIIAEHLKVSYDEHNRQQTADRLNPTYKQAMSHEWTKQR